MKVCALSIANPLNTRVHGIFALVVLQVNRQG
jgi:hypothetical protein